MGKAGIRFGEMAWVELGPGAREKRVERAGGVFRLVEFSPPFEEVGWCVKGHRGFVVSGGFVLEFEGSREKLGAGDAFEIAAGRGHRAVVEGAVVLFMVEG